MDGTPLWRLITKRNGTSLNIKMDITFTRRHLNGTTRSRWAKGQVKVSSSAPRKRKGNGRECWLTLYRKLTACLPMEPSTRGSLSRSPYDRRHVIDCFVHYRINDKIGINGSWSFSSGNMITASWRSTLVKDPDGDLSVEPHITGRNNYRLPPSHRLDVSADFKKKKKHGERTWTVGIYNLYAAQNPDWVVVDSDLRPDGTLVRTVKKRSLLVFLPSISYTYTF